MIVPAFGSNKFIEANKILQPNRSRNNFRRTKLIFIIFFVFFFSKLKMKNEIAGKRIGNGNKREEGKELLVPSEKKQTMQGSREKKRESGKKTGSKTRD